MVDSPTAVVSPRETALGMMPAAAREALLASGQLAGLPANDPAWLLLAWQTKAQQSAATAEAAVAEVAAVLDDARATLPAALAAGARAAMTETAAAGASELADRLATAALAAIGRVGHRDTRAASASAAVAVAAAICASGGVGLLGGAGLLGHAAPLALLGARVPLWLLLFPPAVGVLIWGIGQRFIRS